MRQVGCDHEIDLTSTFVDKKLERGKRAELRQSCKLEGAHDGRARPPTIWPHLPLAPLRFKLVDSSIENDSKTEHHLVLLTIGQASTTGYSLVVALKWIRLRIHLQSLEAGGWSG
jgi:hypothetical protein